MHIALITEGSYPFVRGGVSTWCDQLIRVVPQHDFEVVTVLGDGTEPLIMELPPNVAGLRRMPPWASCAREVITCPANGGSRWPLNDREVGSPRQRFAPALLAASPGSAVTSSMSPSLASTAESTAGMRVSAHRVAAAAAGSNDIRAPHGLVRG